MSSSSWSPPSVEEDEERLRFERVDSPFSSVDDDDNRLSPPDSGRALKFGLLRAAIGLVASPDTLVTWPLRLLLLLLVLLLLLLLVLLLLLGLLVSSGSVRASSCTAPVHTRPCRVLSIVPYLTGWVRIQSSAESKQCYFHH